MESILKYTYPKKEQAVLISAKNDLKLLDYAKSIGSTIGPQNNHSISKISKDKICCYLSKPEIVDFLIETHSVVHMEEI